MRAFFCENFKFQRRRGCISTEPRLCWHTERQTLYLAYQLDVAWATDDCAWWETLAPQWWPQQVHRRRGAVRLEKQRWSRWVVNCTFLLRGASYSARFLCRLSLIATCYGLDDSQQKVEVNYEKLKELCLQTSDDPASREQRYSQCPPL